MEIISGLALLALSYLVGSIPFGLIVVRIANGRNILDVESGRIGGTNAMRAAGVGAGVATAFLDILKGASTALLSAWLVPGNPWMQVLAATMAIVGHNYSIFLLRIDQNGKVKMRGGAGGATAFGGAFGLWPPILLFVIPVGLFFFFIVGYASVTTISVAVVVTLVFFIRALMGLSPWAYVVYGILSVIIVLYALRPNLKRLREGTERMVGLRAYLKRKAAQKRAASSTSQVK